MRIRSHHSEAVQRFGIWATNLPEWLELQFGAAYAGAVVIPMNPLYRASEVEFVLAKSRAAACFVLPEDRGMSLWDIAVTAAGKAPDLRLLVPLGEGRDGAPSWEEWLAAGDVVDEDALERRRRAVRAEDTSQIQFTSGTTGFPKGAELSHGGIVNDARLFAHRATLRTNGRHSNPMPYFHCGCCVMSTLGSVATGSAQLPAIKFDAARINLEWVLGNKLLVSSVNGNRRHFALGIQALSHGEHTYPGVTERILTHPIAGLDNYKELMKLLEDKEALKVFVNVAE